MGTYTKAQKYSSTYTSVASGTVPFGSSLVDVLVYENTNSKSIDKFCPMNARRTAGGGASAQFGAAFKLQSYNSSGASWHDVPGASITIAAVVFNANGVVKTMQPSIGQDGQLWTPQKIEVPYKHRIVATYNNPGPDSMAADVFHLIEKLTS